MSRAVWHYQQAEDHQEAAADAEIEGDRERAELNLRHGQLHATLALAGATALQSYARVDDSDEELADWEAAAGGEEG